MMKKVVIVYPFYQAGGFEKWAANVASCLQDEYSVHAILMGNKEIEFGFYNETISKSRINNILQVFSYLLSNRPDLVISGFTKWNTVFSVFCMMIRLKFIASVHLTLSSRTDLIYKLYQNVCAIIYSRCASSTICVSEGVRAELFNMRFVSDRSLSVLYNPCFDEKKICLTPKKKIALQPSPGKKIKIISVGRLHYQKGFDLLLKGLSRSSHKDNIELNIFGDGPEFSSLENLKGDLNLENVHFKGVSRDIVQEYLDHDIFILSSRYEGFGNVLAEALAAGLICIAFNVKHGPSEILLDGKYGYLVSDLDPYKMFNIVDGLIEGNLALDYENFEYHCVRFSNQRFRKKLKDFVKKVVSK